MIKILLIHGINQIATFLKHEKSSDALYFTIMLEDL